MRADATLMQNFSSPDYNRISAFVFVCWTHLNRRSCTAFSGRKLVIADTCKFVGSCRHRFESTKPTPFSVPALDQPTRHGAPESNPRSMRTGVALEGEPRAKFAP